MNERTSLMTLTHTNRTTPVEVMIIYATLITENEWLLMSFQSIKLMVTGDMYHTNYWSSVWLT